MANNIRFLDPKILSKISGMELRARTVVEGFIYGLHRSPYRGFSVEFAEYREYAPGDDTRFIDWKVYARSDRYYLKEFEEETNLSCHILLDASASMSYGSGGLSKLEYGSYLAASLGYLIFQQRDGVGLMTFDNKITQFIPARNKRGHLLSILRYLDKLELGQKTDLSLPLHQIAETIGKKGLMILISDLLDEPESLLQGLQHIRFKGHDVILFHIMDDAELSFPFENATRFLDMEGDSEYLAIPAMVRDSYLTKLNAHIEELKKGCGSIQVDYHLLNTSKPLDFALFRYL
ncbi:DUF58 domain-containing protein, partial [candidate division KSB1 bacterium]|nr:DUF58 domain-containing protein [candidate division KSB1 bacterium]